MKKIIAVAAAVMISFSAQAQDEWHEENTAIIGVCSTDTAEARAACRGTMIGFKAGFLHGAMKGYYVQGKDKKVALKGAERVREEIVGLLQQIDADEMIIEYARVLKRHKEYRSLPMDYVLGRVLVNLMSEVE